MADAFGVADGTMLVVRRHLVRTQEAPVEVGAPWFRVERRRRHQLERPQAFGRPLYQEVEEVTGRRYANATDQITARQPTRAEAEALQIRPDTPVLHLLHVAYDAEHRPIEVAQATWPGPMTILTEEYRDAGDRRPESGRWTTRGSRWGRALRQGAAPVDAAACTAGGLERGLPAARPRCHGPAPGASGSLPPPARVASTQASTTANAAGRVQVVGEPGPHRRSSGRRTGPPGQRRPPATGPAVLTLLHSSSVHCRSVR